MVALVDMFVVYASGISAGNGLCCRLVFRCSRDLSASPLLSGTLVVGSISSSATYVYVVALAWPCLLCVLCVLCLPGVLFSVLLVFRVFRVFCVFCVFSVRVRVRVFCVVWLVGRVGLPLWLLSYVDSCVRACLFRDVSGSRVVLSENLIDSFDSLLHL